MDKWDDRFLALAEHIATWSKDPSTRTGCVLVRPDRTIASVGFNGFPRGVADDERLHDRPVKYGLIVHAELNAVLSAHEPVQGCEAFVWPFQPCSACAAVLIQAGVWRVVAPYPTVAQSERWGDSFKLAGEAFREAGVELVLR